MKLKYQKKLIILVFNAVFLVFSSTYQQLQGMKKEDYYTILGVSRKASLEDIRRAYKKLAFQYHPNSVQQKLMAELRAGTIDEKQYEQRLKESTAQFQEISAAYETLSDPSKKAVYDRSILGPKKFTVKEIMEQITPLFTNFKREPTVANLQQLLSLFGGFGSSLSISSGQDIYPLWKLVRAIGAIGYYRSRILASPIIVNFSSATEATMLDRWYKERVQLIGMLDAIDRETTAVRKEKALMQAVNALEDLALMDQSVQERLAQAYYTVAHDYLRAKNFAKARDVVDMGIRQIVTVWEYYPIDKKFEKQLQALIQEISKRRDEEEEQAQQVELQSYLVTLNSNLTQLAILVK